MMLEQTVNMSPHAAFAINPVLRWALRYRARGWSVIPLLPRAKRPLLRWEPFQHRLPTTDELEGWFTRWPEANLGIVTGAISQLVVLDVDPAKGGSASLTALEACYGRLPPTLTAETGGGGRHFYFHHAGCAIACAIGLRPGLDLKAEGGYVVAPPSIHPNGRPYRFLPGAHGELREPAPLPLWIASLVREPERRRGHPISWWRQLLREGLKEGERNSRLASLAGLLLHHGPEPGVVEELLQGFNLGRCRPPLPVEEVHAIVASICRTRARAQQRAARAPAPSKEGEPGSVASPPASV